MINNIPQENQEILKEIRDDFKEMKYDIVYLKTIMSKQIDKKLELREFELSEVSCKLKKIIEICDEFSNHMQITEGTISAIQIEVAQLKSDIHSIIYHLDSTNPNTITVELQDILERYENIAGKMK